MTDPKALTDEEIRGAIVGAVNYIRWRDKGSIWCSPGFDDLDTVLAECDAAIDALATREQTASTGPLTDWDMRHLRWMAERTDATAPVDTGVLRKVLEVLAAPVEQAGSTPDETLREALDYAHDCATQELHEARNLYSHYPRNGLGRKVAAAEEMLATVVRALATPTKPEMQSVHPAVPSGKEKTLPRPLTK